MSSPAISAQSISRKFGDVEAVKGVDLSINSGQIYGFLGPNGAGKSTTVKMLVTLLALHSGKAEVAGWDVMSHPTEVRMRIGVALQEAGLDPKQTGRELLTLQGRLYGLSRETIKRRVKEMESLIDIGDAMDRFIETYSGGMKRRIDLAAALLHNPKVLFLDEPTTGLDPNSRIKVWEQVRTINQTQDVTVFLTTQYLEEADQLADRVGIINQGTLVVEGTPSELKRSIGSDVIVAKITSGIDAAKSAISVISNITSVEVYGTELSISTTNGAALISEVALALSSAGIKVEEITLRTPTLDDVFLTVTGSRISSADESESTVTEAASTE